LLPKIERCWTPEGDRLVVETLGYTERINCFITLFWPQKNIIWNIFPRRRNIEFREHLSSLAAYAKRHNIRRIILFIDHASSHKTEEVHRFLANHPVFIVKFLPKKDPNSNPAECIVNKRLSSAVSVNRCHADLPAMKTSAKKFLYKYNSIYAT